MKTNGNAQTPPPKPYSRFTRAKAVLHGKFAVYWTIKIKDAFLRKKPEVPTSQWEKRFTLQLTAHNQDINMIDFTTRTLSDSVVVISVAGSLADLEREYFFECVGHFVDAGHSQIIIECNRLLNT